MMLPHFVSIGWRNVIRYICPSPSLYIPFLALLITMFPLSANAEVPESYLAQVWGRYSSGSLTFDGVQAAQSMGFPSVPSGQWAAGPDGISNNVDLYVEAGPIKDCDASHDCIPHPYTAWEDNYTDQYLAVNTNFRVGSGGRYQYKVYWIGNSQWQADFCDGVGCYNIRGKAIQMYMNRALPYAVSGGESSCTSCPIGTVVTQYNQYNPGGADSWTYWCYNATRNNVGGSITSCNTTYHSWQVKYP